MCMRSISIHLSLIKTWIIMNSPKQSYKYQEGIRISVISLVNFNCLGSSKKELLPPSPRRHLTCSQARSAPLASLPVFLGEKRGHQAEGQRELKAGLTPIHYKKSILAPVNSLNDCSWKDIYSCQIDQNTHTWMPIFSIHGGEAKGSFITLGSTLSQVPTIWFIST